MSLPGNPPWRPAPLARTGSLASAADPRTPGSGHFCRRRWRRLRARVSPLGNERRGSPRPAGSAARRARSLMPLTQRAAGGRRDTRAGGRCSPPNTSRAATGALLQLGCGSIWDGISPCASQIWWRSEQPPSSSLSQAAEGDGGGGVGPQTKKARPLPSTPPAAPPVRGALHQRRGADRPSASPGQGSPRSHPLGLAKRRYTGEQAEPATAHAPTRSMDPRQCETQVSP